jgi:endonuclease/exonuclease/phosphatase family metal-dependent hydrolase
MHKHIAFTILFAFSLMFPTVNAVENSIIPIMQKVESIENLNSTKYSKSQFSEISDALSQKENRIRLATFNMLFNLYDHNLEEIHQWPQRMPRIVDVIKDMQVDIIGVQELYQDQLNDLLDALDDDFAFYSKPSQDGELNGIFYRKSRFEVTDCKVWTMSDTPDIEGFETLTYLQLKDIKTGQEVSVFNTHLAFSKVDKREFQARFIADTIEPFASEMPVILTGDLNTFPNRPDLEKLPFLDGDYIHRLLTQGSLRDARDLSLLGHIGPISTFTNSPDDVLPFEGTGTPGIMLDHIYVSKRIQVLLQAVQAGTVDGQFPSDHMPLIIDFLIK